MNFKNKVVSLTEGETKLTLKEITPVRLIKNDFYNEIVEVYSKKGNLEELRDTLGKGRAKKGMYEGDLLNGELEIGQGASQLEQILSAKDIIDKIVQEFQMAKSFIEYNLKI